MPEDQKVLELRTVPAITKPDQVFVLNKEISFNVPGGQGILGDMHYRVLPGRYYVRGIDAKGTYYRHEKKGIVRSGDLARGGGLFIPNERNGRWGVWIVPNGPDAAYGVLGVAGAMSMPDQNITIVYVANIPLDLLAQVRSAIEPQL